VAGLDASLVLGAMAPLILKRASASRRSGQWRDDDYDVLENGVVVGRIFCLDAVGPQGHRWMWQAVTRQPQLSAPRTAMSRPARLRWPRSLRAGGASEGLGQSGGPLGTSPLVLPPFDRTPGYVA
jgi:hypothetical protein